MALDTLAVGGVAQAVFGTADRPGGSVEPLEGFTEPGVGVPDLAGGVHIIDS
jgi:hypothetical protein